MIVAFSEETSNYRLERCEGEVEGPRINMACS